MRRSVVFYVLVMLALPAYILLRGLVTHSTLLFDDLDFWFYPWKDILYRQPHSGLFALWDPFEFAGMPHFADVQRQLLYPLNAIFYVCPTEQAMLVYFAAHFALAAAFTYRWLRLWDLCQPAAVVGALAYSLSAFMVTHSSQLPILAATPWLPAGLLTLERLHRGASRHDLLLGGLYAAQALLAGSPQVMYMCLYVWVPYLVWRRFPQGQARVSWLAVPGLAALLVLPQLLATAELSHYALRGSARDYRFASSLSLPLDRWWTMLCPYAHGMTDSAYSYHELTLYVGAAPLLLAIYGFVCALRGGRVSPLARFAALTVVVGTLFSLGSNTPVHRMGYDLLPLFNMFRVPARWTMLSTFGLATLAAVGTHLALSEAKASAGVASAVMSSCLGAGMAVAWHLHQGHAEAHEIGLFVTAWTVSIMVVLACIGGQLRPARAGPVLVLVVLVELLCFDVRYVTYAPIDALGQDTEFLTHVPSHPGMGRVMTNPENELPGLFGLWAPYYGLANVQGSNPLSLSHTMDYLMCCWKDEVPDADEHLGMLDHDGFFVMTSEPDNAMLAMLDMRWSLHAAGTNQYQVVPQISYGCGWIVPRASVQTREQALHQLAEHKVDPKGVVLLEEPYPGSTTLIPSGASHAEVQLTHYDPDFQEYDIDSGGAGYLVLSEVYYPGWSATVDGDPAPVVEADGLLRCLHVPGGRHHVHLFFAPWWKWTFWISGLTLALCLAGLAWPLRKV